jgi:hypothetical protein
MIAGMDDSGYPLGLAILILYYSVLIYEACRLVPFIQGPGANDIIY